MHKFELTPVKSLDAYVVIIHAIDTNGRRYKLGETKPKATSRTALRAAIKIIEKRTKWE